MSEVKVNKISPRTNCGTVQLGDSGDTITIPAGATITNSGTASGFGATGSASWNTTVKTADFTAVAGEGYFVNTTSGEVDIALPAGTAGAVVAIKDYAGTFDTNKVTLVQNGSDKIGGSALNATLTTEGIAVTLVFIDSTQGWLVTDSGLQTEAPQATFITATGGTITTVCTNFKVHTFTGPGTFTVCSVGNSAGSNTVDYMVIAGGASGGNGGGPSGGSGSASGGGGAGGYRESPGSTTSYTASPLGASPAVALPVSATGFPITVGAGGATNGPTPSAGRRGNPGSVSTFSTITSAGGGTGGGHSSPTLCSSGADGGSGGGAADNINSGSPGSGNTPPVTPPQGQDGGAGTSPNGSGGGGGGAGGAGQTGQSANPGPANAVGGVGGAGTTSTINGSPVARAGGGGGGSGGDPGPPPGAGGPASAGGGAGGARSVNGSPGTVNTGGGGGGGGANTGGVGGAGGSGIVVIRYKFQ